MKTDFQSTIKTETRRDLKKAYPQCQESPSLDPQNDTEHTAFTLTICTIEMSQYTTPEELQTKLSLKSHQRAHALD